MSPLDLSLSHARKLDQGDPLASLRGQFHFPRRSDGTPYLYFAGHSLGLAPRCASDYVQEEFKWWADRGVKGHHQGPRPWLSYHELLTESTARLVGAEHPEVVVMNTLSVNLHLMMVSFYRPTPKRFKILIENNTFSSDRYAVCSQARFHGYDPQEAIIELAPSGPSPKERQTMTVNDQDILDTIESLGDELALVMLGNCNYLSGQCFDMKNIAQKAHEVGAFCGFNLAHGAGNLPLCLHQWEIDFAIWCSYKYLNAGPGGLAGAFVHQKHLEQKDIPRFEGWWGHDKSGRFAMGPSFHPIPTVEAWQLSNPPIFPLASLRASMELFDRATMPALLKKGQALTFYLESLIKAHLERVVDIVTPQRRGQMLCLRLKKNQASQAPWATQNLEQALEKEGVICDVRSPDILRLSAIPLYNSFEDIHHLVTILSRILNGAETSSK